MAPTLFDCGPEPGDLIEISHGIYQDWAIYIGGNEVIHLAPICDDDSGPLRSLMVLLDSNKAVVKRQKIEEVVDDNNFVINNLLDDKYQPRDRDDIVSHASKLEGHELPFSAISNNCEHFVTMLRYGKPESRQVDAAVGVAAGIGILALGATLLANLLQDDDDKKRRRK